MIDVLFLIVLAISILMLARGEHQAGYVKGYQDGVEDARQAVHEVIQEYKNER